MAAGEQLVCRARHRGEAQERSRRARHRSEAQYAGVVLVLGPRVRRRVNTRLGERARPGVASVRTSSSWRSDGQSSRIDSRLLSRPKSSRGLHNGGITWDDDCASVVEQITAGSKKLKQGFWTHAENLKDLLAQSCRAGGLLTSM